MQQPVYVSGQPTVVVVNQTTAQGMDRSDYAGDFTMARYQNDCTLCGRQKIPDNDNDTYQVCVMQKGSNACCFTMEHPDIVVKAMDIGEISPMPRQDETTVCCYCCCQSFECIMPDHDLCIKDSACLCQHTRSECNVGEADSCLKCNGTGAVCDYQRKDHCALCASSSRQDLLCLCQAKSEDSCDGTCHTCCKGQEKCLCIVKRFAFPPDDDVPLGLGCCGIMCCGGQDTTPKTEQQTVVVVQN